MERFEYSSFETAQTTSQVALSPHELLYSEETTEDGTHLETRTYYEKSQDNHELRQTGNRVRLTVEEDLVFKPPQSYFVPRGQFHSTHLPEDELVVTLIDRWGDDHSLPCRILVGLDSLNPLVYESKLLPWEDI